MKLLLVGFASVLFVTGFVTFWLPLPLGVPLFLISVPILMKYSIRARRWLLVLGNLHPKLGQVLDYLDKNEK